MTAWVAVVAILVGLPLLAWWAGRRGLWDRLRPSGLDDGPGAEWRLRRELARRHGLDQAELRTVEDAVTWGRELTDPRLRAATARVGRAADRAARLPPALDRRPVAAGAPRRLGAAGSPPTSSSPSSRATRAT
ncbi:hypothetical protein [Modestobacter sp. SYSU DS0657]